MNTLYYGDNLDVLRRYIAAETVDLIYLDPPFKSNQSYNVLFAEQDARRRRRRRASSFRWSPSRPRPTIRQTDALPEAAQA